MAWETKKTVLVKEMNSNLTWETVDRAIEYDLLLKQTQLCLKTSSARLFGLISSYEYMRNFFAGRRSENSDEWCSVSTSLLLHGFAEAAKVMKRRVEFYSRRNERLRGIGVREGYCLIDRKTIESRLSELSDPDKKIWARMYEEGVAPEKVISAHHEVRHLLPEEAVVNYRYRTGPVSQDPGRIPANTEAVESMTASAFYDKYVRSDTLLAKSNKLSETYSERFKILPETVINIPRRLERFFTVEMAAAKTNHLRFPSNYTRALVFAYLLGNVFGGAFSAVQLYSMGYALAADRAYDQRIVAVPFSKFKMLVKSRQLAVPEEGGEDEPDPDPEAGFECENEKESENANAKAKDEMGEFGGRDHPQKERPQSRGKRGQPDQKDRLQKKGKRPQQQQNRHRPRDHSSASSSTAWPGAAAFPPRLEGIAVEPRVDNSREILIGAVNHIPDRGQKVAVSAMRTTVAEHEPDGYMAEWLALRVSGLLERKVSAQYSLLFLVNWVAIQFKETGGSDYYEEMLRDLSSAFGGSGGTASGLTFDQRLNLVVPAAGFGSGLTNRKLKDYAIRSIENVVKKLVLGGKKLADVNEDPSLLEGMTLEQLSARFFKNNDVIKKTSRNGFASSAEQEKRTLNHLKGAIFVPNERRRQIHQDEYSRALNTNTKLRFTFGVCGYQHPLSASSDKRALVSQQLLKQRQIFSQRETAAAANWYRLIQFFFPEDPDDGITSSPPPSLCQPLTPEAKKGAPDSASTHFASVNLPVDTFAAPGSLSFARRRLCGLSRFFVEALSKAIRASLHCERVMNDINCKFNCEMLPLGREPGIFFRTKAGLVILDHARESSKVAVHNHMQFSSGHNEEELLRMCKDVAVEIAKDCVLAREHSHHYNKGRPFLPRDDENRFLPIPFFGVEDPLFPQPGTYSDMSAVRCNDTYSNFWLKEDGAILSEAMVSRGILSEPKLSHDNLREVTTSKNPGCLQLYKYLRKNNHRELAADRPRKYDPTPWSSKNTGQSGRNTKEFEANSPLVLSCDSGAERNANEEAAGWSAEKEVDRSVDLEFLHLKPSSICRELEPYSEDRAVNADGSSFVLGGEREVFIAGIETQCVKAQCDTMYPEWRTIDGVSMTSAPDISPMYRYAGKPSTISLKHRNKIRK